MRYHWGLAVGHVDTHERPLAHSGFIWPGRSDVLPQNNLHREDNDDELLLSSRSDTSQPDPSPDDGIDSADEGEVGEEKDGSEPDLGSSDSNDEDDDELDEEEELAFDEMYGET